MHVTFFGARLPLTKTIVWRENAYAVTAYPHVTRLTSFQNTIESVADFEVALRAHARQGHCLFNGQLTQPLIDESRAGKTLRGSGRDWVVFDFDKVPAANAEDVVRRYLPECCHNVSYVAQCSASMFWGDGKSFSGHIIMLLEKPSTEAQLRDWIESINFALPDLEKSLNLTDSGLALHWPLDRSAAYDSRLIYIAPPTCHGFTPALKPDDAITLVKKKLPMLKLPTFQPVPRGTIEAKINALRRSVNLIEKDLRTRPFTVGGESGEVIMAAEPGQISDIKPMGDHYIKFNLNGGNSMGYWIDLRNPSIIKNFKGEPWLLTKEIDELFFKRLCAAAPRLVSKPPVEEGTEVLAFYATNQNSAIKIGSYSPIQEKLELYGSTETAAKAWLSEFGVLKQAPLDHMFLRFNPQSDIQFIPGSKEVNTFHRTSYMKQEVKITKPSALSEIPPLIDKIIESILGDPTEEVKRHFVNWLAFIFQKREKTGTAWVLSGRTGTGKSSFIRYVLTPLFGSEHVVIKQYGVVAEQFNGYLEKALFVIFEECDTNAVTNTAELMSKVRHYVTDTPIAIRRMNTDSYEAPSYCNFILTSNKHTPVEITSDDRRFNLANRQENEIFYTPNEILSLERGVELETFADVLLRWPLDLAAIHKPIMTQAKIDVHEATTPINQLIAEAIKKGDLQFFLDRVPSDAESMADFHGRFNPGGLFKEILDQAVVLAQQGKPQLLKEHDLFVIFRAMIPDPRYFQDSPTWRKRHYKAIGLDIERQHRVPGNHAKRERGILIQWVKPEYLPEKKAIEGKVVPIKGVK